MDDPCGNGTVDINGKPTEALTASEAWIWISNKISHFNDQFKMDVKNKLEKEFRSKKYPPEFKALWIEVFSRSPITDNSKASEPKTAQALIKIKIKDYLERIEKPKNPNKSINYSYGLTYRFFASIESQAANRQVNHEIAKSLLKDLDLGFEIEEIFNDKRLTSIKEEGIQKFNAKNSVNLDIKQKTNHTIRSDQLNEIIREAKKISGERFASLRRTF
jgi:hypothetical protein